MDWFAGIEYEYICSARQLQAIASMTEALCDMGRVGVPGGGEVVLTPGQHDDWTASELKHWLADLGVLGVSC